MTLSETLVLPQLLVEDPHTISFLPPSGMSESDNLLQRGLDENSPHSLLQSPVI